MASSRVTESSPAGSLSHRRHSVFGCQLIHDATQKLSFPPNVMVTAQSIFHRFYMRRTFEKSDAITAAMGCFVLGCKVEEVPILLREVVFVFFELFLERNNLPIQSLEVSHPVFIEWKSELIIIERMILKELGFSLYTIPDHPHQYILYIMNTLQREKAFTTESEAQISTLAESAWHYLNESKKIDIELRYESLAIACGAVLLASKIHDISFAPHLKSWWLIFDVDYEAMQEICNEILDMYDLEIKGNACIHPLCRVEYQEHALAAFGRPSSFNPNR